jgi:hypothetical protein
MISESGAIRDISEIAAALQCDVTEEETSRIEGLSMEDLLGELDGSLEEAAEFPTEVMEGLGALPAMESLMEVVNQLRESGSISRADATTIGLMTASMEGFENAFNNLPLVSYTEMPSKVNFDASMEGLVSTFFRKAIEIIKKLIDFIKKQIKTVIDKVRGRHADLAKVEAVSKQVERSYKPVTPDVLKEVVEEKTQGKPSAIIAAAAVKKSQSGTQATAQELYEVGMTAFYKSIAAGMNNYQILFAKPTQFGKYDIVGILSLLDAVNGELIAFPVINHLISNVETIYGVVVDQKGIKIPRIEEMNDLDDFARIDGIVTTVREAMIKINTSFTQLGRANDMVVEEDVAATLTALARNLGSFDHRYVNSVSTQLARKLTAVSNAVESYKADLVKVDRADENRIKIIQQQVNFMELKAAVGLLMNNIINTNAYHMVRMAKLVSEASA